MCNNPGMEESDQLVTSICVEVPKTTDIGESEHLFSTPHEQNESLTVAPVLSHLKASCPEQMTPSVSRFT